MNTNLLYIFTALEFIYIIYLIRNIYKIKKEFRKNVTKTCYSEYFKDLFDDKDTIKYSMRPLVDHRDDTLTGIMLCTHNTNDMYDEYTAEDMKQIVDKVMSLGFVNVKTKPVLGQYILFSRDDIGIEGFVSCNIKDIK